jgi:hypothetical protein
MPPVPDRIEHRNAQGALIAEAVADADGLTLRVFDGDAQRAYLQVSTLGRIDFTTGGGVFAMDADGNVKITGLKLALEIGLDLSTSDPLVPGWPWNDNGLVRISAG